MRTTITIDDALYARAAELTGVTEKSALLRDGLETLIRVESARRLAALERNLQVIADALGQGAALPTGGTGWTSRHVPRTHRSVGACHREHLPSARRPSARSLPSHRSQLSAMPLRPVWIRTASSRSVTVRSGTTRWISTIPSRSRLRSGDA